MTNIQEWAAQHISGAWLTLDGGLTQRENLAYWTRRRDNITEHPEYNTLTYTVMVRTVTPPTKEETMHINTSHGYVDLTGGTIEISYDDRTHGENFPQDVAMIKIRSIAAAKELIAALDTIVQRAEAEQE